MALRPTVNLGVLVFLFLASAIFLSPVFEPQARSNSLAAEGVSAVERAAMANSLPSPTPPQPDNSWSAWIWSMPSRLAERLRSAAGSGHRDAQLPGDKLAVQPNQTAVWTAPLPPANQTIQTSALNLSIKSAMMPNWSPTGDMIVCRLWLSIENRWVIAAYKTQTSGLFEGPIWFWPSTDKGQDFSPVWAPKPIEQLAFVRRSQNGQTDIYVLSLNHTTGAPQQERQVTSRGNVRQIVGWDENLGILFTAAETLGTTSVDLLWSVRPDADPSNSKALCVPSASLQGRAPDRHSLIVEESVPGPSVDQPRFLLREYTSEGEMHQLFGSTSNSDHWPSVSPNGRVLAFDSNRSFDP